MGEAIKTYATHFCGIGGACLGLEKAGLECRFATDWLDSAVEYREANIGHRAVLADICDVVLEDWMAADLFWTSPPCQTYSNSSREFVVKNQEEYKKDKRNNLFLNSVDYIRKFRPRFVVFENVMGLLTHESDGTPGGTFCRVREAIASLGYHVEWNVLDSLLFGLPQERERVFLAASRDGETGLLPADPSLPKAPRFGDVMQHGVTSKAWGGQTYKTAYKKVERVAKNCGAFRIRIILPQDVLPTITCGWGGGATRKKVAIVDEVGGVPFLRHPTILEGARAQGFPDGWKLPGSETEAWKLIGNAVSPPVAKAIARHIMKVAVGENPTPKTAVRANKLAEYSLRADAEDIPQDIDFEFPG
jgi:DNA (cytosine-5)-methyltransferase 1